MRQFDDGDADADARRRERRAAKKAKREAARSGAAVAPPPTTQPAVKAGPPPGDSRPTKKAVAPRITTQAPATPGPRSAPVVVVAAGARGERLAATATTSAPDRKRFMSAKTGDVFEERDLRVRGGGESADTLPTHATPAPDLRALAREVEALGVTGLDKRAAAALESKRLEALGCRPAPRPRTPACIGLKQAAYQKARAASELEAAIDAGLVSRKGLGKKRRREAREREGEEERGGLRELASFRGGVLRVTGPAPQNRGRGGGGRERDGGRGRGGHGGGRGRGRGRGR